MAEPGLLVFAGKEVGAALLGWLLRRGDAVQRVIAATVDDAAILDLAAAHGVTAEVYGPETQPKLAAGPPYRWLLNLWSPHKLLPATLAIADRRLNVHPGLVPHGRGNDNAAWAIRLGQPAGVSLLEMTADWDAGGVWAEREVPCPLGTRGRELHQQLLRAAIELFQSAWPDLDRGSAEPRPQVGAAVMHTRRQTNLDRCRDGSESLPLSEAVRWALAHDFSPGTTAELTIDGRRYRVRLNLEELP